MDRDSPERFGVEPDCPFQAVGDCEAGGLPSLQLAVDCWANLFITGGFLRGASENRAATWIAGGANRRRGERRGLTPYGGQPVRHDEPGGGVREI